jgi:hypothetical protein
MRVRGFRWIVVGVILAIGLFLALDVVALQYLESRGATELARAMTAEEATVDLGSIPFLPGYIGGRISRAEVDVRGASGAGGLRVQNVKARMTDLRFNWRDLLALSRSIFATRTTVRMKDPLGMVEIGQDDLGDFLKRHVPMVGSVLIDSSGIEVKFLKERLEEGDEPTQEDLTEAARLLPRVADGRIVLSLVGVSQIPPALRPMANRLEQVISLPRIPEGLRTDVRLGDRVFVVEANGTELDLTIGEGSEG